MTRAAIKFVAMLAFALVPIVQGQNSFFKQESASSAHRAVLTQYCATCHNNKLKTAGLELDKLDLENVPNDAAVWEKVITKLRTMAMPPAGVPRPSKETYDALAGYLEGEIDRAALKNSNPGRPVLRRLNRAEYANVIRDLLSLDVDVRMLLPPDDSGYGFDNIGDVLSTSPLLLDRYVSAAFKISRLAIGDPGIKPVLETYKLPKFLLQDERMSETLPFGSRGGIAVRHFFPLDAEYVIKVRLKRTYGDVIKGLAKQHQIDVRVDGERINLFTIGGEHKEDDAAKTEATEYKETEYVKTADASLDVRFAAKAGQRIVGITFPDSPLAPEGVIRARLTGFAFDSDTSGNPMIDSVTIGGPYESKAVGDIPSRRRIFLCYPRETRDEESCARTILSSLVRRAYRRTVSDSDLKPLLALYRNARNQSGFEAGIRSALQRILVSPEFLFRIEDDPRGVAPITGYRLDDLSLASRLSFFLWSSMPDDELLRLGEQGKLKNSQVVEGEVQRLLADPRAKALVENFAGQWLFLRNVRLVTPDTDIFPDFDENLREAMQTETEMLFANMIQEDRSILSLLDADYTFINERLARHYQIPNVYGSHFRRVSLAREDPRRGILGQASVLTVTSYANRTSPVLRGKWLLENLLGAPPPPPPPNVPALKDRGEDGQVLTMRQRMEQHRKNPACMGCHSRMDPLGFALENYDAIGKWRTSEEGIPIDSSGQLPNGTKFQGPAQLREILLSQPEQFATTFSEKLLTYALGRGLEYYDMPSVRKIVRDAAQDGYRWSSIVRGVVRSVPFQMRRSREP